MDETIKIEVRVFVSAMIKTNFSLLLLLFLYRIFECSGYVKFFIEFSLSPFFRCNWIKCSLNFRKEKSTGAP